MFSLMASLAVFGNSFVYCGDLLKAMAAIARFIQLSDVKPGIDMDSAAGLTLNENIGNIYLRDVEFAYRSRPNINVLNKLIVSVKRGEKIALVGGTGCGIRIQKQ